MKLLTRHCVAKPWGRVALPKDFCAPSEQKIGEIWFQDDALPPALAAVLVKYLYTSEKLSVQVHPNDEQARAAGMAGGKSECWFITHAEPDATLGIGTRTLMTADQLIAAASDGSIENEMVWHKAAAGQCWYIPAGTIHAIGPGVTLIEVQQNNDITYRLYDYGRPRALHLAQAASVALAGPYDMALCSHAHGAANLLSQNPNFDLWHFNAEGAAQIPAVLGRDALVIPLEWSVSVGDAHIPSGEVAWVRPEDTIAVPENGAMLLVIPA